ncbi:MAG: hypothetical protein CMK32_03705 [Porticoccaceae bacterium]|nr:hypothetical protein [Porticoccaceae bacterium]
MARATIKFRLIVRSADIRAVNLRVRKTSAGCRSCVAELGERGRATGYYKDMTEDCEADKAGAAAHQYIYSNQSCLLAGGRTRERLCYGLGCVAPGISQTLVVTVDRLKAFR